MSVRDKIDVTPQELHDLFFNENTWNYCVCVFLRYVSERVKGFTNTSPPPPNTHVRLCRSATVSDKLAEAFEGLPEDEPCAEDEVVVDSQDRKEELEAAQGKTPGGGGQVSRDPLLYNTVINPCLLYTSPSPRD